MLTRCFLAVLLPALSQAQPVPAGAGSYRENLPANVRHPPARAFHTENLRAPLPTNDWSSSAFFLPFSDKQFPHPLAVHATKAGLRIFYPGTQITAGPKAIMGVMPDAGDLTLGHSAVDAFDAALVDGYSDWFVRLRFGDARSNVTASYGHGSPYVYATYAGGEPRIMFAAKPTLFTGDANAPALGVTVGDRHYGLFAPAGSTWEGLDSTAFTCRTGGKSYFSAAVLPNDKPETLALFARHAHAHVTDTKVDWNVDPKTQQVTTSFAFTTNAHEGDEQGTLFALYPHQWRHARAELTGHTFDSIRGRMKLGRGSSFITTVPFPGILPALPKSESLDNAAAARLTRSLTAPLPAPKDTYWEGKQLGKLATAIPIAEQYGLTGEAETMRESLRARLENWLTAAPGEEKTLFSYDPSWGTLIGYPDSFGSADELNDHHFHYGYFIKAAAEVARHDPQWAADGRWGAMVKLLIRDIASPDRDDPMFPFLRNFDPYAGHSWASGHARFGDGNNNESSSEAMNAWAGVILWGHVTGDTATRDLGIWLFATEMTAIQEYWFDVHGENFPKSYLPPTVTMVWGGKGDYLTWFGDAPEITHGINFLPITGASLYLGLYPEYAARNYQGMVKSNGHDRWQRWSDLLWMYQALSDAPGAMNNFNAAADSLKPEEGNSLLNAAHWIHAIDRYGPPDRTVTADTPLYAVFKKNNGPRTCCAWNTAAGPLEVTFSDGTRLTVPPNSVATRSAD
jgi:endoglucanase Acf2